jgi:hypothetical protein
LIVQPEFYSFDGKVQLLDWQAARLGGIELICEKTYYLTRAVVPIADIDWPCVMRMTFVNRVNCWETPQMGLSAAKSLMYSMIVDEGRERFRD